LQIERQYKKARANFNKPLQKFSACAFVISFRLCFHSGMSKTSLSAVAAYCRNRLRPAIFNDYEGAANGLQVENSGAVTKIAAAVDASLATVNMAAAARADLLLVHHGLFWGPTTPWTGPRRALLQSLIGNDIAVYSCHLPLDAHRQLGNNALLCAALGFVKLKPFFVEKGRALGWQTRANVGRAVLAAKIERTLGRAPVLLPGGPERCRRIGVVTGAAGSRLRLAAAEGVDTFITGEGPHWTGALAEELGVNVFYGGHYATETFGVKALAAELSKKFHIPWVFLDHPTGL
jgi:dinuclear metal center YbgI/SA1388 family protein